MAFVIIISEKKTERKKVICWFKVSEVSVSGSNFGPVGKQNKNGIVIGACAPCWERTWPYPKNLQK